MTLIPSRVEPVANRVGPVKGFSSQGAPPKCICLRLLTAPGAVFGVGDLLGESARRRP